MKLYLIRGRNEKYVQFIIFKNTARKKSASLLSSLIIDRHPNEKDFVNTSVFFTDLEIKALVIKNKSVAECMANLIDGYVEEVEL